MSSVGGSTAIIVHDSQRTRRRKRGRPPARPRGGSGLRPGTQAVFVLALFFLVATIALLGMSFRRLVTATRAPAPAAPAVTGTNAPVAAGSMAPPPPSGGPQHREVVLHLRDLVSGVVWLQSQPGALSAEQMAKLQPLMPAVRTNLQGPPNLVDAPLEAKFRAVLSDAQYASIEKWYGAEKTPPDFMASLATLERVTAGGTRQ